ncbi:hypothetical protein [Nocardia abscessus]|uniref:hypothetical protein n=1 Tax=Nocardia abscessus TaxID=120957 RepID=UPI00245908CD|nr:hypothetical protein [Nocardia abscessus]
MRNLVTYLAGGRPIPASATLALFALSLAFMQIADPMEQFSGYWPGIDVSAASRTLMVGVGVAAIAAWVSQRWPLRLRMEASARSGLQIALRDLIRLYTVVIALFFIDYAILVVYRFTGDGAGSPKISVVVDGAVWLLFCVTVGWAVGTVVRKAAAVFIAMAAMLLLSVGSVMANDGHIGFPLLAGRQLASLPSYAVELSPDSAVTIAGVLTTFLVVVSILAATTLRRRSWATTGAALAVAVVLPIAASVVTGGNAWLQPRAAAAEPICVGIELQVCSWAEDTQRLAALEHALPRLITAMRNTGYPPPRRLSVSGATTEATAKICPFRTVREGIVNILGRVPVESTSCIGSDQLKQCPGDARVRADFLALTQIYMRWLTNFPLEADGMVSRYSDGRPTDEYVAAERVSGWPLENQFAYMSKAYRAIVDCDTTSVPSLLGSAGHR